MSNFILQENDLIKNCEILLFVNSSAYGSLNKLNNKKIVISNFSVDPDRINLKKNRKA